MRTFFAALLLVAGLILTTGCSNRRVALPSTVPVKGKIFLPNGSPVPGGRIHFKPKTVGKIQEGIGEIEKDGSFSVTSFEKDDGLMPGEEYTVFVEPVSYKAGPKVDIRGIPQKYHQASTSDLKVEVTKVMEPLTLRMR